ncbi:F-box/LRR-repeat protein-like protein [Tanacetum coccineum]
MDRISNLPDDLLAIIISSLNAKEAVSTSVLSKRRKAYEMYLDVSCLELPSSFFTFDSLTDLELSSNFTHQITVPRFSPPYPSATSEPVTKAPIKLMSITSFSTLSLRKLCPLFSSKSELLSKHYLSDVPTLQFMSCLEIEIPRLCGWTLLFSLLENSPILQTLTIRKDCEHYASYSNLKDPQDFDWTEPETPPSCLQLHLEVIKIAGFFWMKCDTKAVKYLLGNAKVLKNFSGIRVGDGAVLRSYTRPSTLYSCGSISGKD